MCWFIHFTEKSRLRLTLNKLPLVTQLEHDSCDSDQVCLTRRTHAFTPLKQREHILALSLRHSHSQVLCIWGFLGYIFNLNFLLHFSISSELQKSQQEGYKQFLDLFAQIYKSVFLVALICELLQHGTGPPWALLQEETCEVGCGVFLMRKKNNPVTPPRNCR